VSPRGIAFLMVLNNSFSNIYLDHLMLGSGCLQNRKSTIKCSVHSLLSSAISQLWLWAKSHRFVI
jgi:hypothetical protein